MTPRSVRKPASISPGLVIGNLPRYASSVSSDMLDAITGPGPKRHT
jgi:hypothetical protein